MSGKTSFFNNNWVKLTISLISLGLIFLIFALSNDALFVWSIGAIITIETNSGDWLKTTSRVLSWFGGNLPNIVAIGFFTAMFKRRHQAFSYLILWTMQVFISSFIKLALRQGRPSMVIPSEYHEFGIPWTTFNQVISLGCPSCTALQSMCVSLTVVIEYIYHTEEQYDLSVGRLTITPKSHAPFVNHLSLSNNSNSLNELPYTMGVSSDTALGSVGVVPRESLYKAQQQSTNKYPLWKKILYITLAVAFSILLGFVRLFLGAHSLDQILLGWMLGIWLALTYFTLMREHVHRHIKELTTGQANSSNKVYYIISSTVFVTLTLIVTLTFLINKEKPIKFLGGEIPDEELNNCAEQFDYWSTWAESAYMASGLGGYYGILYQNKKYGGQLFIQEMISQERKIKIKRFIYRYLIIAALGLPMLAMTIVVFTAIRPRSKPDLTAGSTICEPQTIQTLIYFIYTIFFFGTFFVIFAFSDTLCLKAKLYDRAPVPEKLTFSKDGISGDQLFLSNLGYQQPTSPDPTIDNNSQNFTNITIETRR